MKPAWLGFFWVTRHRTQDRAPFGGAFPEICGCSLLSCPQGWVLACNEAPHLGNVPLTNGCLLGLYSMGHTYTTHALLFLWHSSSAGVLCFYMLTLVTLLLGQAKIKWGQGRKLKEIWSKPRTVDRSNALESGWLKAGLTYSTGAFDYWRISIHLVLNARSLSQALLSTSSLYTHACA